MFQLQLVLLLRVFQKAIVPSLPRTTSLLRLPRTLRLLLVPKIRFLKLRRELHRQQEHSRSLSHRLQQKQLQSHSRHLHCLPRSQRSKQRPMQTFLRRHLCLRLHHTNKQYHLPTLHRTRLNKLPPVMTSLRLLLAFFPNHMQFHVPSPFLLPSRSNRLNLEPRNFRNQNLALFLKPLRLSPSSHQSRAVLPSWPLPELV